MDALLAVLESCCSRMSVMRAEEVGSSAVDCSSAYFLRFLPAPEAFFNECESPFSLSVLMRRFRRATSVSVVGRMGIMSLEAYDSSHFCKKLVDAQ